MIIWIYGYLLSSYIALIPLLGMFIEGSFKNVFFFLPPLLFTIGFLLVKPSKQIFLQSNFIKVQVILTLLYLFSCFTAKNPGLAFPQLFSWLNIWFLVDLFIISNIPPKIFLQSALFFGTLYSIIFIFFKIQPLEISLFTNADSPLNPPFQTTVKSPIIFPCLSPYFTQR